MKRKKTDWLVAIVCSEVIAAGVICITMLGYYFWRMFLQEVETMEKETKKYRDPFKGMSFNGNPVSKEEYIAAYESYVKRCSGETKGQFQTNQS